MYVYHSHGGDSVDQVNQIEPKDENEKKLTWQQRLVTDLRDVVVVLVVFLLLFMMAFRIVSVKGPSMYDTLLDGDRLILLSSVFYREPKQGDVIVASLESFKDGECIVKRVIATEGQVVDIDFLTGEVRVDGILLDEPYIHTPTDRSEGVEFPVVVEPGHVFVMGDNRGNSLDSRSLEIGQIDKRQILGKAIFLLFPGNNLGQDEIDFSRIGVIG